MTVYSLSVDGKPLVEVEMELPEWFPFVPRIDRDWLRGVVSSTLRNRSAVVVEPK